MAGVEPARLTPLPPQDSVSTNSTTSANYFILPTHSPTDEYLEHLVLGQQLVSHY